MAGAKVIAVATWSSPMPAASPWVVGYDMPIDLTEPTEQALNNAVEAVSAEGFGDINLTKRVVHGSAAATLIDEARGADMLVVGTRGLGGFKGLLLGSVSHHLANHAPCPLVIVPAPKEK